MLSLVAQDILTDQRAALSKALQAKPKDKAAPENFEQQLRQRMIDELRHHTDRAGTSHRHYWERLHQHAKPEVLAQLIEEARDHGDAKEASDKQQQLEEKHGIKNMEGRLEAVEDHLVGDGNGRFDSDESGNAQQQEKPTDVNAPDTGAGVALLLRHYRGKPLGVEAKKPKPSDSDVQEQSSDEYAITTPEPESAGGARVIVYTESGIRAQSSHASPHEALAHMVAAGYTSPAPGTYATLSQNPDWHWIDDWARKASSGDENELHKFHQTRPHPAARGDLGTHDHAKELDGAMEDKDVQEPAMATG